MKALSGQNNKHFYSKIGYFNKEFALFFYIEYNICVAKLYVIGTPIGNLGDITYRAVETLKNVDYVAAEDTRHTLQLLNHLEIKKPLIS